MNSQQSSHNTDILPPDLPLDLQFVLSLHMLVNSAKIHQDNNPVLISSVQQFVTIITKFFEEEDEVTLLTSAGRFYVRLEKVVYRSNIADLITSMLDFFEKRELKGLRFFPATAETSVIDIASFIRLLIKSHTHDEPSSWLEGEMDEQAITWVELVHETDATY